MQRFIITVSNEVPNRRRVRRRVVYLPSLIRTSGIDRTAVGFEVFPPCSRRRRRARRCPRRTRRRFVSRRLCCSLCTAAVKCRLNTAPITVVLRQIEPLFIFIFGPHQLTISHLLRPLVSTVSNGQVQIQRIGLVIVDLIYRSILGDRV